MNTVVTIDISASPERAWAVMSDVERWPEWTESVSDVEMLTDGPLAAGSKARVKQPKFPPVVWRVTSMQDGRSFEWENASPAMRSVGRHTVEPTGGGSRVTLEIEQTGLFASLLGWWLKGVSRKYVEMEARGLKQRLEAEAP